MASLHGQTSTGSVIEYTPTQLAATGEPTPAVEIFTDSTHSPDRPVDLAFDASGDLWVSNLVTNSLAEYTPSQLKATGRPMVTITSDATHSLANPGGIAFDASGDLFVNNIYAGTDGPAISSVAVFTPSQLTATGDPAPVRTIGGTSTDLDFPAGIAIEQPPAVDALSPSDGPDSGGTPVTIHGGGFTPDSTVDFGSTPAKSVTYVSPFELNAQSPGGSGTVSVTVGAFGGTSTSTATSQFTYLTSTTQAQVSPSSVPFGTSVKYTATVSGPSSPSGLPAPTGTVTFSVGSTTLCTTPTLSAGTGDSASASCGTTNAPMGADTVTATYSGDASFPGSEGTTSLTVGKASTKTSVTIAPTTTSLGSTVTYSATVTSTRGTPTGKVTFTDGHTTLCTTPTLTDGSGQCKADNAPIGSDQTVTATYSGDADFSTSSGTATISVGQATPTTPSISDLPASGTFGGGFSATVSTNGTGTKSVTSNSTAVCTVSGLAVAYVGVGTCSLTAHVAAGTDYRAANGTAQTFSVGQATPTTPTISDLPASGTFGGGFTATVASTGTGTKSISSNSTAVCTVSGLAVSYVGVGTCSLTAQVAAGTDYRAANGTAQTFSVGQATPTTPTISDLPASGTFGGGFTATVASTGTGTKSISSNSTAVCTVSGLAVSYVGVGTCSLTAHVATGTDYRSANGTAQTFSVGQATPTTPTISDLPASGTFGGGFTATVSTSGTGSKSVTSNSIAVCTVSGLAVAYVGVGTCSLTAHVATGTDYRSADGTAQTFSVGQATPTTPSISNLPASGTFGGGFTATVSTTGTGTKSISSNSTAVCTVSGLAVSYVGVGTCSLTAHVAAGTDYRSADGTAQTFSVGQATPTTPSISDLPASGTVGGGFTATVATTGTGTKSISSNSTAVCTVSGLAVSSVGVGTCSLTAHVAAGTDYRSADGTAQTFSVGQATPTTPTISDLPASGTFGEGFTATVSTSGTGSKSVNSNSTAVCTVSGLVVSYVGVGTCSLTAHVAAGTDYRSADGTAQTFSVGQATPTTPTISDLPASGSFGGGFTAAVSTNGTGTKSISSNSTAVCTVSGLAVTYVGVGTCSLTAHVAAGTDYGSANGTSQTFSVGQATPTTPTISDLPASGTFGGGFTATVSTTGTGTKSISSNSTAVCTVSGLAVSYVGVGTCSLTAHVATGTDYRSADGTAQTFSVGQATPTTPTISDLPASGTFGGGFTVTVSTTGTGTRSVTSNSTAVCTVSGLAVSYVGVGTCSLTAHVAAGTDYRSANGTAQTFSVGQATPTTPTISDLPTSGTVGAGFTATVTTNGTGTKSVTSNSTAVCTVSGLAVSYVGVGTCSLTAHVATGTDYRSANGTAQTFSVGQATPTTPTISDLPASGTFGGGFTATVSTTGTGTKSITSNSTAVCTVSGLAVSYVGVGTCSLTAHVAAGTDYRAANGTAQTFSVGQATPTTPSISDLPASGTFGGGFTATVSTSGTGTKSISSSSTAVCTVSGLAVSYVGVGTCSLTAEVAAGADYRSANGTAQTFSVGQATPTTPTISDLPASGSFGGGFTATVSTTGTGTKSISSSSTAVCTVSGLAVSYVGVGTCSLTAQVAAGTDYRVANGTAQTFSVGQATPTTPSISDLPASGTFGGGFTVTVATTGTGTKSVSSNSTAVCTVSGLAVSYVGVGTCSLTAHVATGTDYRVANGTAQTFSVGQATPTTPSISDLPASGTFGGGFTATVSTTGTGTKSISSNSTAVCTVSGLAVSYVGVGTCSLTAQVAAGTDYRSADGTAQTFSVGQATPTTPTISDLPASGTFGGGFTATVSTTGTGTKSISSNSTAVCTVSGLAVSYVGVGTCSLTAHVATGTDYRSANGTAQTFSVGQATPTTPTISDLPASGTLGGGFTATVDTSGTGTKSITSNSTAVCTMSGLAVSYVGVGTCSLTAHVAEGSDYRAANGTPQTFAVGQATPTTPTISDLPASGTFGGGFTATVSTTGTGTKSVTSNSTAVCTVSGLAVTYVGVGTCSLTAHVATGTDYRAADGTAQTFSVGQATPTTPTISDLPASGTFGDGFTATVASTGTGTRSVTSNSTAVCTASGLAVSYVGVGTCSLTAHVAAGTDYGSADGTPQTFSVGQATPTTPTISDLPAAGTFGGGFTATVSTTGTGSEAVTSNSTAVCTASGLAVSYVGVGTCSLTPHVAAGTDYGAANGTAQTFAVGQATPTTPTVSDLPASGTFGDGFTATVASTGTGTRSVTSNSTAVCTVRGLSVSYVGVGTCSLTAHVAAGTDYGSADGTPQTFSVGQATPTTPTISDLPASGSFGGGFTGTVSTTGTGTKSVTSNSTAVCTVSGLSVYYLGVGTCSLTAHVATGTDYGAANGTAQTFSVGQATPTTPTISDLPASGPLDGGFTATVATTGTGTKSISSNSTAVCTASGLAVSYVGVGTCSLTAHVAAGTDYGAANGTAQTFSVGQTTPTTPTISNLPASGTFGGDFTATVSTSGTGTKSVTSNSTAVCTATGLAVSYVGVGTCSLTAHVAAGTDYRSASGTAQTFSVGQATPTTPTISDLPTSGTLGGGFTATVATTGTGTKSVTSNSTAVCTVSGPAVSYVGVGTCSLTAHVAAGTDYRSANGTAQTFSVGQATPTTPTISDLPASGTFGGGFTATVSTTGTGTKSVSSNSTGVCTVSGLAVTYVGAGTCSLTAHVAAGTDYRSADGTAQTFSVSAGAQGCSSTGVGSASFPGGYWMAGANGAVYSCGDAPFYGSLVTLGVTPDQPIVAIAATPTGHGYWLVASDGGIFAFGSAHFYGSMGGQPLDQPVVGMTGTPEGGYYEVASDGGLFAFGPGATFYGSMGGKALNQPVVGMAETLQGGYYEVARDGGIFGFGPDTPFLGSMGGRPLNRPVVGMAVDPAGGGYYEVASDGGVFSFGAPFHGSTGCLDLTEPVVGIEVSPNTTAAGAATACGYTASQSPGGYQFVAADGGVFSFGNAVFAGSLGGEGVTDIVGMVNP